MKKITLVLLIILAFTGCKSSDRSRRDRKPSLRPSYSSKQKPSSKKSNGKPHGDKKNPKSAHYKK